jgi:hypothetical protein
MKKLLILFMVLVSGFISAQPIYHNHATSVGSTSPATIVKPAGTTAGELLIIGFMYEKGTAEVITAPNGWNLILRIDNSTDCGMATYYKIAQQNEPNQYSFTYNNSSKWCLGISRIGNVDTLQPINAISGITGASNFPTAPSLTTWNDNTMVLCFYTNKKSDSYISNSTTTKRYDEPNLSGNQPSNMLATFIQTTAGVTGNKPAKSTTFERWSAQQIAINATAPTGFPIELLSFTGTHSEGSNHIKWVTATEINNDYFTIEKFVNGSFVFYDVVPSQGNSYFNQIYNYTDNNITNETEYYRLKQTDFDGTNKLFAPIAIKRNCEDLKLIQVTDIVGRQIDPTSPTPGIKLYLYSNGSVIKK